MTVFQILGRLDGTFTVLYNTHSRGRGSHKKSIMNISVVKYVKVSLTNIKYEYKRKYENDVFVQNVIRLEINNENLSGKFPKHLEMK